MCWGFNVVTKMITIKEKDYLVIGSRLRCLRELCKISQKQLSASAGISIDSIEKLESGKLSNIPIYFQIVHVLINEYEARGKNDSNR